MRPAQEQTGSSTAQAVQRETAHAADHAQTATQEVAGTAKEQARHVAQEAGQQTRRVVADARERLTGEIDSQAGRTAQGLRTWADELDRMAESGTDGSPVRTAVRQLSGTGRRAADYLDEHGVGGVFDELGQFARRRPGTFLVGAAVTGFLAGRLAKATARAESADRPAETGSPNGERTVTGDDAAFQPTGSRPADGGGLPGTSTTSGTSTPSGTSTLPGTHNPGTPATGTPAPGSYGATPYEQGAQATPPTGPTGEVR